MGRFRELVRGERGFTMAPMMASLLALLIIGGATAAAVSRSSGPTTHDRERKQALAAAEAGVSDYLARLRVNANYWSLCADPANKALNQPRPATRGWSDPLPGTTARYSLELLPVKDSSGKQWTQCSTAEPDKSMLDAFGSFRIRATGEAAPGGARRSLIATYRPGGFLNYVYYTEYETSDPAWYVKDSWGHPTSGRGNTTGSTYYNIKDWATLACKRHYFENRAGQTWAGSGSNRGIFGVRDYYGSVVADPGKWNPWDANCTEIQFADGDKVLGPLHTNDSILLCGSPQFGEKSTDRIEVNGPGQGWRGCNGNASPNKVGQWVPNSGSITLPDSNSTLKQDAPARLRFRGKTTIEFKAGGMVVNGYQDDGTKLENVTVNLNDGEVIYVDDDPTRPCGETYDPLEPYNEPAGCGNVYVKGTYDRSLTVGAKNDIIVNGNLKRANDGVVFGLISDNWIRVYHKFDLIRSSNEVVGCRTSEKLPSPVQIDAAILSLKHSFTVDGYFCGPDKLGTLTIRGAIGQMYRGPVGTGGNSSGGTGYLKDYRYDRRLQFRSPPRFLDPVLPNWQIRSVTEQIPAEA